MARRSAPHSAPSDRGQRPPHAQCALGPVAGASGATAKACRRVPIAARGLGHAEAAHQQRPGGNVRNDRRRVSTPWHTRVALVGLLTIVALPGMSARAQDALPTVGTTIVWQGWQVTLDSYGVPPAADPGLPAPRGTQVQAAFTVTDLQNQGSPCTEDIYIASADGQWYTPLTVDQTPGPPRVVRGPGAPEPAAQQRYCVTDALFEVDPAASNLTLNVLGVSFQLP
jgi:hypothetical protein